MAETKFMSLCEQSENVCVENLVVWVWLGHITICFKPNVGTYDVTLNYDD